MKKVSNTRLYKIMSTTPVHQDNEAMLVKEIMHAKGVGHRGAVHSMQVDLRD